LPLIPWRFEGKGKGLGYLYRSPITSIEEGGDPLKVGCMVLNDGSIGDPYIALR
jgi:hypothetical protein